MAFFALNCRESKLTRRRDRKTRIALLYTYFGGSARQHTSFAAIFTPVWRYMFWLYLLLFEDIFHVLTTKLPHSKLFYKLSDEFDGSSVVIFTSLWLTSLKNNDKFPNLLEDIAFSSHMYRARNHSKILQKRKIEFFSSLVLLQRREVPCFWN